MNNGLENLWGPGAIRVFISHLSEDRVLANGLQARLERWGIASFVAHDDIEPGQTWQDEILRALSSMDLLVALLTTAFKESDWTNQEIGYAIGRGVPVLSVRIGRDPYGFIARYQAINNREANSSQIADEIFRYVLGDENLTNPATDVYLHALSDSGSFDRSNDLAYYLPRIAALSPEQEQSLVETFNMNGQVREAWRIREDIIELLLRTTGSAYEFTDRRALRRLEG